MATKSKKRIKRRSSRDLFQQVRRSFEKGKYKQALKDAKVCFRQAPTEERRLFLECAYMGRAQQLAEQGLQARLYLRLSGNEEARRMLAVCCVLAGQWNEALKVAR